MIWSYPPLYLFLGACAATLPKNPLRHTLVLLSPLLALAAAWGLDEQQISLTIGGLWELQLLRPNQWGRPFAIVFCLSAFLGLLYALPVERYLEDSAALIYAASAVGAVLAGDLFTFYCWWELLALAATFLILRGERGRSHVAAFRYLVMHIAGGLLLLMGILWRLGAGYDSAIGPIGLGSPGGLLIFLGIGLNCAFPLLHTWLIDSYPEASPSCVVFLASFTTKTAVYALLVMFAGTKALIAIGVIMAIFPILFAILEDDLRKVLAYSVINQVGFMVVGVGIGTELSLQGAVGHAMTDILFKGLLFMTVGVCLYRTGSARATDLGGLFRQLPFTAVCCIVGAAALSAVPGFSGFVTKSMITSSVKQEGAGLAWAALGLLIASAGVLPKAGFKVPFYAFFARPAKRDVEPAPLAMKAAMGIAAGLCLLVGLAPGIFLYPILPGETTYQAYATYSVLQQLQVLSFAGLAIVLLICAGLYPREIRVYNHDGNAIWDSLCRALGRLFDRAFNGIHAWGDALFLKWLPARAVHFFSHAPARLSAMAATVAMRVRGARPEAIAEYQERLYHRYRTSTNPLGLSAIYSIVLLAILAFLALYYGA